MRLPHTCIISEVKLTKYLLVQRPWDDKSAFLAAAGFSLADWPKLRDAIQSLARSTETVEDGVNPWGTFYRTDGDLVGPNLSLAVTLIWINRAVDGQYHFVTLKPRKAKS
jgi:hypothetical protein